MIDINIEMLDEIHKCPSCSAPIKIIKTNYILKRIQEITESNLRLLKLCSTCKRKVNSTN